MKVLVTGGQGFIGQWVVKFLVMLGHDPVVLDHHVRRMPVHDTVLPTHADLMTSTFCGDIRDGVAVTEAMAHVDAFIHLAAVLGTQETIQNPIPAAESNLVGGLNILQAAAQYQIPGVYIGVGNHWMNNTYSITKTMIERFVDMYNNDRGTHVNIVRAMNAYGPGQVPASPYGPAKVRKITPSFVCRALHNDPIEIYGDGEQVSDMVWVGDVADTLIAAMLAAKAGQSGQVYEIGPQEHNTVNDVAELIVELSGSKSEIVHLPMRPGEIPGATVTADTSNLKEIGISVNRLKPLRCGMNETIDWFQSQL